MEPAIPVSWRFRIVHLLAYRFGSQVLVIRSLGGRRLCFVAAIQLASTKRDGSKFPPNFKHEIDEKYGAQFYITSLDGRVAKIYPLEVWEEIEAKLEKKPDLDPAKRLFLERTNYYGQEVEMDAQGRVLLPGLLRDSADLKAEVIVVGSSSAISRLKTRKPIASESGEPFTPEDEEHWRSLGSSGGRSSSSTRTAPRRARMADGDVWPCSSSFTTGNRLPGYSAWRNLYRCDRGPGRAQFRNRKTPGRTGSFDWLR